MRGVYPTCREYFERLAMRRGDVCYAPSRFVAEHFRQAYGIDVQVLRPPAYFEGATLSSPSLHVPDRYFLHFGQLRGDKGSALLAAALPIAWESTPDLMMVWSGQCGNERDLKDWRSLWGQRANQVYITGPLHRSELYAMLKRADAAVLPSQVDNLPNTVIESLMFGIPVLGSRGASIDELVEEGRTGHLVALGDVQGLADALTMMWLKNSPVSKGFSWHSKLTEDMQPARAVANLIGLVDAAQLRTHN
jgi:glycosyltransferase involved in cell wall biosynthesis